ncbi:NAD(P)-binding domain-containing protein [Streptomyces sp. CA-243310]|uniref:NAD(P)-binding domain-containing protein n=1 Tax=Streptomyces sp. CA-243310 TaxID=3240056 RepID=UPI003D8D96D6
MNNPLLGAARPATNILVAGYGVITAGIIPHLVKLPDTAVTITSRHLIRAPAGTRLLAPDGIEDLRPDIVLGCFADDGPSRAFWEHERVTAAVTEHRPVCIELSTISPAWAEAWHSHIDAHGGIPVECPVTGSRPGAIAGTLSGFLHTPRQDPRTARTLGAFTHHRYAFSRPGNPARFKLIYNAWGAAILHTLSFARQLPLHLGDDYATAARIVTTDGWMATIAASKLSRVEAGDYDDPDFALRHMLKDLHHARDLLGDNSLITTAIEAYDQAAHTHGPYADFTAVAQTGGTR